MTVPQTDVRLDSSDRLERALRVVPVRPAGRRHAARVHRRRPDRAPDGGLPAGHARGGRGWRRRWMLWMVTLHPSVGGPAPADGAVLRRPAPPARRAGHPEPLVRAVRPHRLPAHLRAAGRPLAGGRGDRDRRPPRHRHLRRAAPGPEPAGGGRLSWSWWPSAPAWRSASAAGARSPPPRTSSASRSSSSSPRPTPSWRRRWPRTPSSRPGCWPRQGKRASRDERRRLAAEIHDTIAQGLAGIITQLQVVTSTTEARADRRRHLDNAPAWPGRAWPRRAARCRPSSRRR